MTGTEPHGSGRRAKFAGASIGRFAAIAAAASSGSAADIAARSTIRLMFANEVGWILAKESEVKARKDATFQGNGLPAAVVRMAQDGNALAMSCCHEFIAMELVRSIRRVSLTADKDTEAALLQAADEAEWFMFTLKGKNDDI